jgi:hypothetical protein
MTVALKKSANRNQFLSLHLHLMNVQLCVIHVQRLFLNNRETFKSESLEICVILTVGVGKVENKFFREGELVKLENVILIDVWKK